MDRIPPAAMFSFRVKVIFIHAYTKPRRVSSVAIRKHCARIGLLLYSINITYSNMFIIGSVSIVLIGQKLLFSQFGRIYD